MALPADLPDLLTEPLIENPELHAQVRMDLEERLRRSQPEGNEQTDEEAADRLPLAIAARQRRGRKRLWIFLSLIAIWLGAIAMELSFLPDLLGDSKGADVASQYAYRRLDPARDTDCDFIVPAPESGQLTQWRENRENPAAYLAWVDSQSSAAPLPADYDEVWRQIDPDNAVWPLLKAEHLYISSFVSSASAGVPFSNDDPAFEQALNLVEEASRMPRYDDYRFQRLGLLQKPLLPWRSFVDATLLGDAGNRNGWSSIGHRVRESIGSDPGLIISPPHDTEQLSRFIAADQRCELLESLGPGLDPASTARHQDELSTSHPFAILSETTRNRVASLGTLAHDKAGRGRQNLLNSLFRQSPLSRAGLLFCLRVPLLVVTGLLLLMTAVLWLRRLPASRAPSAAAYCLEPLIYDRRRTLLTGLLLPGLVLALCFSTTVLADPGEEAVTQMLIRALVSLPLLVLTLIFAARHDLNRCVGFLGYRKGEDTQSPVRTFLVIVFFPIVVLAFCSEPGTKIWKIASHGATIAAGIALLWMLMRFFIGLFGRDTGVRHRLLARWLIPFFLGGSAALLVLTGALHLMERHIFSGNQTHLWDPPHSLPIDREYREALEGLLTEWKQDRQ